MDRLSLPAVLDSLAEFRRYSREAAAQAGVDEQRSYQLQLAVDEIATNIIAHGHNGERPSAIISISGEVKGDCLVVTIEDQASAFDPRSIHPPATEALDIPLEERGVGGLGIFLARKSVDRFDYRREDDRNLNILAVRIRR
jgi:serine/threonine-protein kinase RsbW